MAWKEMTIEEVAKSLGVSISEVREKQHLMDLIVKLERRLEFLKPRS